MPRHSFRSVSQILKSGIATADELNTLFATMAREVGLAARPSLVANATDLILNPKFPEVYFLDSIDMAVRVNNAWKIYDVSTRLLPAGMLSWQEEGMYALVCDPKNPEFVVAPAAEPAASALDQTADVELLADGSVVGHIKQVYTGHEAQDLRSDMVGESDERRTELLKERIMEDYPNAEVTEIKTANLDEPENAAEVSFQIKIPNYVERTGRRMFFQPFLTQKGSKPIFSATERKYDIRLPFAWREVDHVRMKLPAGLDLENAESPGGINFGKVGIYDMKIGFEKSTNTLICNREFEFGREGLLLFPVDGYTQIKRLFDGIHRRDTHTLALRQAASTAKAGGQ